MFFSFTVYCRVLRVAPCAIWWGAVYFVYGTMHLPASASQLTPHLLSLLVTTSLLSVSVSLLLFHKSICVIFWIPHISDIYGIYLSFSDFLHLVL